MIFDADDIYEIEEDYKTKLKEKDKEIEILVDIIRDFECVLKRKMAELQNKKEYRDIVEELFYKFKDTQQIVRDMHYIRLNGDDKNETNK